MRGDHLKGVWFARTTNPVSHYMKSVHVLTELGGSSQTVCDVSVYSLKQAQATAALISASQELLLSCQKMYYFIDTLSDQGIEPVDEELLKNAKHAIQKARNEQD